MYDGRDSCTSYLLYKLAGCVVFCLHYAASSCLGFQLFVTRAFILHYPGYSDIGWYLSYIVLQRGIRRNLPPSIAWSIQHGVFALNARHQLARPDVLGRAELLSFPKNCTRLVARTAIEQPRKVELTEFSRRSPFTTYQNLKWSTFSTSPVQRKRNRSYQFSRFQQKGFDLPCRFPAVLLPFSA